MSEVREVIGVFDSETRLQEAIDELLVSGFNHADLSLLASEAAIDAHKDLAWRTSQQLEDDPSAPRAAYVSPESLADAQGALVGTLAYIGAVGTAGFVIAGSASLAGAILAVSVAGGLGAAVGAVLARVLGQHHADELAGQIARGGLLLWVRTPTSLKEARALEILRHGGGKDVHAHDLPSEEAASASIGDENQENGRIDK